MPAICIGASGEPVGKIDRGTGIQSRETAPSITRRGFDRMRIEGRYQVAVCDWANEIEREGLLDGRETVFVHDQQLPPDMEIGDDAPRSVHVLARAQDGAPVGSGRLTAEGRIGRVAVLREWRGRGVGTMRMQTLLEQGRARGLTTVSMHAQRDAV